MDLLPEELSVEMREHRHKLVPHVRNLTADWGRARAGTGCFADGDWQGKIDKPLARFLHKCDAFMKWFDGHHPRRKEEVAAFLGRVDGAHRRLPPSLEGANVGMWQAIHDFFSSVAHHRKQADDREMSGWRFALEDFLLDRLYPRTFADTDDIDKIIQP